MIFRTSGWATKIADEIPPTQTLYDSIHSGITFTSAMVPTTINAGTHSQPWKFELKATMRATASNKAIIYSQLGNILFPTWECFVPNVGIIVGILAANKPKPKGSTPPIKLE